MNTVLLVDDEEAIREMCACALEDQGYQVEMAGSGKEALAVLGAKSVDVVLTDLRMPGVDGMELLRSIRQSDLDVDVVVMTGYATIASAVEATKLGACDYITKPFKIDDLTNLLERTLEKREAQAENRLMRERLLSEGAIGRLIGDSAQMQSIYRFILKVAPKRCPVLIIGESGTGKEVVARAIHANGPWRERPFVPVDCGALTPTLIESELFGHTRGSFTGATQDRQGLFRAAADGTIFLDEIGELPLDMQAKLLRVLQESEFRAVGSDVRVPLRARVLAATNRELENAIKDKTFRGDLYYRLNVVSTKLPPLRTRKDDIIALANYFVARHGEGDGQVNGITPEAMDRLVNYDWPGNVRELENCIRHALALTDSPAIELRDLPPALRWQRPMDGKAYTYLETVERRAIAEVLEATGGHRANAAKLLGLGKTTLYSKLKEYGLDDSSASPGSGGQAEL